MGGGEMKRCAASADEPVQTTAELSLPTRNRAGAISESNTDSISPGYSSETMRKVSTAAASASAIEKRNGVGESLSQAGNRLR